MGLIKDVPIRHRLRTLVTLTTFTDELHSDVGAAAFIRSELKEATGHDWTAKEDLVIRTAAGGAGTLLVLDTDYVLLTPDPAGVRNALATTAAGTTKTLYEQIQITNASYQTGALYFSGKDWGDFADPEDLNNITVKIEAKAATFTVADKCGYRWYNVTTAANAIFANLPLAANNVNLELTFVKADSGAGWIVLKPAGSDTLGAMALPYIFIIEQGQKITIKSDGVSKWYRKDGELIADTGYINTNEWRNRNLGTMNIPIDTETGTLVVGEKITEETSGNTWMIQSRTALNLVCWCATGTGFATNNKTLTGSVSGATALVNTATTTKILNNNFTHGWGKGCFQLAITCFYSTAKTEATTFQIFPTANLDGVSYGGLLANGVDANNFKLETPAAGPLLITGGQTYLIATNDYYYRARAVLTNW
jgi:hypothetical protein